MFQGFQTTNSVYIYIILISRYQIQSELMDYGKSSPEVSSDISTSNYQCVCIDIYIYIYVYITYLHKLINYIIYYIS